jgi:hypothetical protein
MTGFAAFLAVLAETGAPEWLGFAAHVARDFELTDPDVCAAPARIHSTEPALPQLPNQRKAC